MMSWDEKDEQRNIVPWDGLDVTTTPGTSTVNCVAVMLPPDTYPPFGSGSMTVPLSNAVPLPLKTEKASALSEGGARFDKGKSRVDLIPADVLLLLGEIYQMGAEKYDASNWRKGMKWSKVYGPLFRHLLKFWRGDSTDEESGKLHIMHVVWNAIALALYVTRPEYARFDDRQDAVNMVDMPESDRQKLYV